MEGAIELLSSVLEARGIISKTKDDCSIKIIESSYINSLQHNYCLLSVVLEAKKTMDVDVVV